MSQQFSTRRGFFDWGFSTQEVSFNSGSFQPDVFMTSFKQIRALIGWAANIQNKLDETNFFQTSSRKNALEEVFRAKQLFIWTGKNTIKIKFTNYMSLRPWNSDFFKCFTKWPKNYSTFSHFRNLARFNLFKFCFRHRDFILQKPKVSEFQGWSDSKSACW